MGLRFSMAKETNHDTVSGEDIVGVLPSALASCLFTYGSELSAFNIEQEFAHKASMSRFGSRPKVAICLIAETPTNWKVCRQGMLLSFHLIQC